MPHSLPTPTSSNPLGWVGCWLGLICDSVRLAKHAQKDLSKHLTSLDLNETQFLILWQIASAHEQLVPQSALVDSLGLSKAQISQHLEKLRDNGWILAVRTTNDRRCQEWRATHSGERLIRDVSERIDLDSIQLKHLEESINGLSAHHRRIHAHTSLHIASAEEKR